MSLDWDIRSIRNYETVCFDYDPHADQSLPAEDRRTLSPVTNALIWATMAVDIGDLTEKMAPEFYARLRMWEKLMGSFLTAFDSDTGERTERPIKPEEVWAHVGLSTNVSTLTRPSWMKKITGRYGWLNDRVREFDWAKEKWEDERMADGEADAAGMAEVRR